MIFSQLISSKHGEISEENMHVYPGMIALRFIKDVAYM